MSLAQVAISSLDFDLIFDHLTTHMPRYRNMHMRAPRQRKGRRVLWYLHAMHAKKSAVREIEGMISGPGVLLEYLISPGSRPGDPAQILLLDEDGDQKEISKITKRFLKEILSRVHQERADRLANKQFNVKRIVGQYYLRRARPGMAASHLHCQRAIASKELDPKFVAKLAPWKFLLLCPSR